MTQPGRATTLDGFRVLGVAIRREPWMFTIAVVGSALFGVLTVADAWVLGWSTDHVLVPAYNGEDVGAGLLWAVIGLFVGVAVLRAVGIASRRLAAGLMQYRMQAHSRRDVTRQYLRLPLSWHQRHPTGELLSNASSDVEAAWGPIAPLPMAVGTVVMMVIAVVQMFAADAVLASVGVLVFPATIAANLVYQRLSSPLMTRAQQLRAELSEVAHESFDGAVVVKTLGREEEETARFADRAHTLREVNIRAGRVRAAFDPLLAALPNLGVLAVLLVGVHRVNSGATPAGDVVTVAYLLMIVAFPIRSLGWLLGEFPRSVVGYGRVRAVLDAHVSAAETEPGGPARMPSSDVGAQLVVNRLAFGYASTEEPETAADPGPTGVNGSGPPDASQATNPASVLTDVSFNAAPGETVALVGATASGKSTLVTLLTGLVRPTAGEILIDDLDLDLIAPRDRAETLAVVPQSAFVFDDTVRGNVTLGQADLIDDDVWEALTTAQAAEFVARLPRGLDTQLGERGTALSGGQRQRLALARALVRHPRLLILDDATSAVDPEVEARILNGLRTRASGPQSHSTTLIVVAYRKATISLADRVVFLADGRIVDQGSHLELLERNPAYASLVNAYEVAR